MLIPDVNLLVYAYDADAPHHALAREWWEGALSGERAVGLPWLVTLGFIRIMTHRRVLRKPMEAKDCVKAVRSWLDQPRVQILTPGEQHGNILFALLTTLGTPRMLTLLLWPLSIRRNWCPTTPISPAFRAYAGLIPSARPGNAGGLAAGAFFPVNTFRKYLLLTK
jgi:toxin-antitoxin system PIN domain toxin